MALTVLFGGTEVPGVSVYGYWPYENAIFPAFPSRIWTVPTRVKNSTLRPLDGSAWSILVWDIHIVEWPDAGEWTSLIKQTLQVFTHHGAKVAWCGLEGLVADPPFLFDPIHMSGGVWACLTSDDEFLCRGHLGQEFNVMSDFDMAVLKTKI